MTNMMILIIIRREFIIRDMVRVIMIIIVMVIDINMDRRSSLMSSGESRHRIRM